MTLRLTMRFACTLLAGMAPLCPSAGAQPTEQKTFKTPDDATRALISAARRGARDEVVAILGAQMRDALSTGNPAEDQIEHAVLLRLADEATNVRADSENPARAIIYLGDDEWPFPVPLVKNGATWQFDTKAGLEEIAARALGRDELGAIGACHAYVQAQIEYASVDRTGEGILQFAQRIRSTAGRHDGLFWSNDRDDDPSPLGPFVAQSVEGEGALSEESAAPFFGYYYRILTAQGEHAIGGARDFVIGGHMLGGFALVAWPAQYGATGVRAFIVNQLDEVYERDLGTRTSEAVQSITTFDPDSNWSKVQ